MKKVVILSGVSGSGKSSMIEHIKKEHKRGQCATVSADNFFMVNGEYRFNPTLLPEAHKECFRAFIYYMQHDASLIIVDNTNTTSDEIAPYYLAGEAFGYEVEIITLHANPEEAAARNAHGVPMQGVMAQAARLAKRSLPPWYKNTDITV